MKFKWIPLVVCLLAGGVPAQDVSAGQAQGPQEPAPASVRRPYRGIFGAPPDASSKQSLDVTASIFGAYDDDIYAGASGGGMSDYARQGTFAGATASVAYEKRGDRFSGGLSGQAGVNQYFEGTTDGADRSNYYGAGGAFSAALSRSTRLALSETVTYSPQYLLGPFQPNVGLMEVGDQLIPTQIDLGLFRQHAYRSGTGVQLTHDIGRRSSFEASYGLSLVHYTDSGGLPDYRWDSARAGFNRQLTRHATLRAGYGYQTARYVGGSQSAQHLHSIDLGVDYGRAVSLSRRTHFGFSTGSAIWAHEDPQANDRNLYFRLIGNARLDHEIGRTWTAQLAYDRGLEFYQGFSDPFLTDGVTGQLDGFIVRRVRFNSTAAYSVGSVGVGHDRGFNSVSANAGLEFALTRTLALFTRYVYYRYDFDANVSVDPRLLRKFDRQGVRAGLTLFIPVIR